MSPCLRMCLIVIDSPVVFPLLILRTIPRSVSTLLCPKKENDRFYFVRFYYVYSIGWPIFAMNTSFFYRK